MPQYRLLRDHADENGVIIPAGTIVGDDTETPWNRPPSHLMEGVDDDGKEQVAKLHRTVYGRPPPERSSTDPVTSEATPNDKPVSEQQRLEMESGDSPREPRHVNSILPKGGVTPAVPDQPVAKDEDMAAATRQPGGKK